MAAGYEDAAAFRRSVPADAEPPGDDISVAVAGGASESLLAGRWARLLVEEFAEVEPPRASVSPRRRRGVHDAYVEERRDRGKPIACYEEPGLARGAYATLLVAHFFESGTWSAVVLGDSCLFHVQEKRLLAASRWTPLPRSAPVLTC